MTTMRGAPFAGAEMPWGTHAAYVYSDTSELSDTVVPYIAAGLSRRERCIWVTSCGRAEVERLAGPVLTDFDDCVRRGQLEIVDAEQVYSSGGPRALGEQWLAEMHSALAAGFSGLCIAGDGYTIAPEQHGALVEYEHRVSELVRAHHIRALCGYRLTDSRELAQASEAHDWLVASGAVMCPAGAARSCPTELSTALGMAAHELRMPLQILSIGVEIGLGPADVSGRQRLRRAVKSLSRIASDLEEVAQLGARTPELSLGDTELTAICRRVIADFLELYPSRRIVLAAERPISGRWDEARLQQMTANLIACAIRYGNDPIQVLVRAHGNDAMLEVIAAGGAPSPAGMTRASAPFGSLGGRAELGLGLLAVREIALAHGGELELASQGGRFTALAVRLPLAPS